jgi:hypothetical protein
MNFAGWEGVELPTLMLQSRKWNFLLVVEDKPRWEGVELLTLVPESRK